MVAEPDRIAGEGTDVEIAPTLGEGTLTVQRSLVPEPYEDEDVAIGVCYLPARALGGDVGTYFVDRAGRLCLLVSDVTGHGLAAALLANRLYGEMRSLATEEVRPGATLARMGRFLGEAFAGTGRFATYCCARVCTAEMQLVYTASAHPPLLLLRRGDERARLYPSQRSYVGIGLDSGIDAPDGAEDETAVPLEPGDRLYLYTDGLLEPGLADCGCGDGGPARSSALHDGLKALERALLLERDRPIGEQVFRTVDRLGLCAHRRDDVLVIGVEVKRRKPAAAPDGGGVREPEKPPRRASVRVEARARALPVIRDFARSFLEATGVRGRTANEVVLAVDEACSNIVRHACCHVAGTIDLSLEHEPNERLTIVIEDDGEKPVPEKLVGRPLDRLEAGGLGLHFIAQTMDLVAYDTGARERGTRLTLRRDLQGTPGLGSR